MNRLWRFAHAFHFTIACKCSCVRWSRGSTHRVCALCLHKRAEPDMLVALKARDVVEILVGPKRTVSACTYGQRHGTRHAFGISRSLNFAHRINLIDAIASIINYCRSLAFTSPSPYPRSKMRVKWQQTHGSNEMMALHLVALAHWVNYDRKFIPAIMESLKCTYTISACLGQWAYYVFNSIS